MLVGIDEVVALWAFVDIAPVLSVADAAESDELAAVVLLTACELVRLLVSEAGAKVEAEIEAEVVVTSSARARKANAIQQRTINRFPRRIVSN